MRKIVLFLMALIVTVSMRAETVEGSRFFDNTYIGLNSGVSAWLKPQSNGYENFGKSIQSVSSLRFGKMITPIIGVELEGEWGFANRITFVDHTNVGLNVLWNANNTFYGFKGVADKVEVVPFVGLGWHHTFGWVTNDLSGKGGVQLNINLGKTQAWQINVIPSVTWLLTNDFGTSGFNANRAYVSLQVGATYKFKNSKGTHNFVLCPFKFTQSDIDALNTEINKQRGLNAELEASMNQQNAFIKQLEDEIANLKGRDMIVEVNGLDVRPIIGFEIGSSEILPTQMANVFAMAEALKNNTDTKVSINGFADIETGSHSRNLQLSKERAEVVKNLLLSLGVNETQIATVAHGAVTPQVFQENNWNRAVIFDIVK